MSDDIQVLVFKPGPMSDHETELFPDNISAICELCGAEGWQRPHNPKHLRLWCMDCASKKYAEAQELGEEVEVAWTEKTAEDVKKIMKESPSSMTVADVTVNEDNQSADYAYHLIYNMGSHPEGITKSQLPPGVGACDALICASILYPPDGGISVQFFGKDGRTNTFCCESDFFQVWAMMTQKLKESENPKVSLVAGMAWMAFQTVYNTEFDAEEIDPDEDDPQTTIDKDK